MFKNSALVRALDFWGTTFANIYNQTVNQINSEVLPHLRISNYMGSFFNETPGQTYNRFTAEQLLSAGGDPELHDYIKAVMAGEVYPTYRKKHGKPVPTDEAEWNALGFTTKPAETHSLDHLRRRFNINNRRDSYFTIPTEGDLRIVRCFLDGSVALEECTPRELPEIVDGDWMFSDQAANGLPRGWMFTDSTGEIVFHLSTNRETVCAYTKATLEIGQSWTPVALSEALLYCDPDQYVRNLRCLGPGLNPELYQSRTIAALRLWLLITQDEGQTNIHSDHYTTYGVKDEEGNTNFHIKHSHYKAHLDKTLSFDEYIERLLNDTLDGDHPLYSLYARIGSWSETKNSQESTPFWERVYKGFGEVEQYRYSTELDEKTA